jgi:hypothetical protein
MPETAAIMVFSLTGKTRDAGERSLKQRLADLIEQDAPRPEPKSGPVPELNSHAEEIAKMLEGEILAALPPDPGLSVQVELRFRSGSIVLIGTAAILSWTGSIVLDVVRDEIAGLIRIAAQRAIGAAMAQWAPGVGAMQCTVTPQRRSPAAIRPEAAAASGQTPGLGLPGLRWQNALTVFLTLAVLVLLIDRFFDVSLRTAQAPVVLAPATPTSPAATPPASRTP